MTQSVGITGGIGSGKTTVCKIFAHLGIPVYAADDAAKHLMETNLELRRALAEKIGISADVPFHQFKELLGVRIFADPAQRAIVESLVHPMVAVHFLAWLEQQTAPFVLKEAAILFETGSYKHNAANILVTAPESVRIQRVLQRDAHLNAHAVWARIQNQWPDSKKLHLADFVINNPGNQLLLPQILGAYENLIRITT